MRREGIAVTGGKNPLQRFNFLVQYFQILFTQLTNQMIMMPVAVTHFKAGDSVTEIYFFGYAGCTQQFEGAVNSCLPHIFALLVQVMIELFSGVMFIAVKKVLQYGSALWSIFKRILLKILAEYG